MSRDNSNNWEVGLTRDFKGLSCRDALTSNTMKVDIEQAIAEDLFAWGLDPNSPSCSSQKRKFFHRAVQTAIEAFECKGETTTTEAQNPVPQEFPIKIIDAMKHVLRDLLDSDQEVYDEVNDKISTIDERLFYPPFWVNKDYDDSLKIQLKRTYDKVSAILLDPFVRFTNSVVTKQEYFQLRFFEDDERARAGHLFEALVARHAILDISVCCKSCGCSSSFRWMGGFLSPWRDLVCTSCQSTYEIKSKQSSSKIEQEVMKQNRINGGSFPHFYDLKRETKDKLEAKQYLVLVSRDYEECSHGNALAKYWRVHVAKIHRVLPAIKPKSFADVEGKIKLKSFIQVKKETYEEDWFRIPYVEFDQEQIYREVFEEYFKAAGTVRSMDDASSDITTRLAHGSTPSLPKQSVQHEAPSCKKETSLEAMLQVQKSRPTRDRVPHKAWQANARTMVGMHSGNTFRGGRTEQHEREFG